ncbi:MAG: hypothetical protein J6Q32_05170 [Clostridia bacterium]|nr:hypothetical protein [Clostridia bacterium]
MKKILIIAIIAIVCIAKLVQTQFADVDKVTPQEMYELTLIRNGVAR